MRRYIGYFKNDKRKELKIIEKDEKDYPSLYPYEIVASDEIFESDEIIIVKDITDIIEDIMKGLKVSL